ncbi:hypothetical protein CAC42_3773 [Sphaceloma murrayae]|uniref:Capsule polysaccharide biosynthesis protein n=1 Tax=Sphaceloma murrayae TaxID=2082308 RepID=A0A2K1QH51_9PEZI|nr:hypothetical protein CAC42_3773 [Sphaceloma murrayae]
MSHSGQTSAATAPPRGIPSTHALPFSSQLAAVISYQSFIYQHLTHYCLLPVPLLHVHRILPEMLALTRVSFAIGILSAFSTLTALIASPSLRSTLLPDHITSWVPTTILSHILKLFGVFFIILNLKNVPVTWHIRVLRAIFYQVQFAPKIMAREDLFKPLVTTSWNSILDCDYNLHKSNSTYLKDLDVARAHYIGALLRTGIRRMHAGDNEGLPNPAPSLTAHSGRKVPDGYIIALGGVACIFRKEIKPLARFEIWTRLLAWDEKWIYTVSHVVKAGAVRPRGYALQPWKDADAEAESFPYSLLQRLGLQRKSKPHPNKRDKHRPTASPISPGGGSSGDEKLNSLLQKEKDPQSEELRRAVYATSIAKYVCKKGRTVIAPEIVFERSHLLPTVPRPAYVPDLRINHTFKEVPKPVSTENGHLNGNGAGKSKDLKYQNGHADGHSIGNTTSSLQLQTTASSTPTPGIPSPESGLASLDSKLNTILDASPSVPKIEIDEVEGQKGDGELTWDHVHNMRLWGLKYANQFDGLAGLHDDFARDGDDVLGVYGDLIY